MTESASSPSRRAPPVDEASLRAGLRQAWGWAILFGAGEFSFGLFAAEIEIPAFYFGLLTGVPLMLGPFVQVLSANSLDRYGRRKRLVEMGALTQAACFVPLALLAFCIARADAADRTAEWVSVLLLAIVCVYAAAGSFTHPPYSSMISELVPEQRRGDYFARVHRDVSLLILVAQASIGGLLLLAEKQPPKSCWALHIFTGAFVVAGIARLYSCAQIAAMNDPPYEPKADAYFTFVQFIRRTRESNFVKFVLFVALMHFSAQVSGPYFLPYWKYELKYDTSQWIVLSGAATLAAIVTLPWWGRFSNRFGNKCTLIVCSLAISAIPLGWMFTTSFSVLVCMNLYSGFVWSGFNLASWNYILDAVTPHKRARCVAYFNIVCGVGLFGGSMFGAWLQAALLEGGWLHAILPPHEMKPGLLSVFFHLLLASTLCRLLTCLLLLPLFRELRRVELLPVRQWIFQIARVRIPVGVGFDAEPLNEEDQTADSTDETPEAKPVTPGVDARTPKER